MDFYSFDRSRGVVVLARRAAAPVLNHVAGQSGGA